MAGLFDTIRTKTRIMFEYILKSKNTCRFLVFR